jgi:hypothetical protein
VRKYYFHVGLVPGLVIYKKLLFYVGWMPGPVIFGRIIDGTCSLWKYTCGERQSCLLYDIVFFRNAVHGYGTIATSVAMGIVIMLYIYFRVKGVTKWREDEKKPEVENTISVGNEQNGKVRVISICSCKCNMKQV